MASWEWCAGLLSSLMILAGTGCQSSQSLVQGRGSVSDSLAGRQIRAQSAESPGFTTGSSVAATASLTSDGAQMAPNATYRTTPTEVLIPAADSRQPRQFQGESPQRRSSGRSGILGKPFVALAGRTVRPGDEDLREVFGNAAGVSLMVNAPLSEFVDLRMSLGSGGMGTSITDGLDTVDLDFTAVGVSAGLVGHFQPNNAVDPYVFGNLMYVDLDFEASSSGYSGEFNSHASESMVGYNVGAGVQCELNKHASISPYLSYTDEDEYGNGGASIGPMLNIWGGETLMFFLEANQSLGDGTRMLGCGAGLQF